MQAPAHRPGPHATLLKPGDTTTNRFGPLRVRTDLLPDGIAITVLVGCERSSTPSHSFPTERLAAARIWYAALRTAGQGVPVHKIEAQLAVLQAAAVAVEGGAR